RQVRGQRAAQPVEFLQLRVGLQVHGDLWWFALQFGARLCIALGFALGAGLGRNDLARASGRLHVDRALPGARAIAGAVHVGRTRAFAFPVAGAGAAAFGPRRTLSVASAVALSVDVLAVAGALARATALTAEPSFAR